MFYVSYELTMPNRASWNGRWSGENEKYFIVKRFGYNFEKLKVKQGTWAYKIDRLLRGERGRNFYYSFGDGWGANVKMELVDKDEAKRREKSSAGFCGYGWMVDSIERWGAIYAEPPQGEVSKEPACA